MEQAILRIPDELASFITGVAKGKGLTRNALIVQIFWDWKQKLSREELLNIFGKEKLLELEIGAYKVKKETK